MKIINDLKFYLKERRVNTLIVKLAKDRAEAKIIIDISKAYNELKFHEYVRLKKLTRSIAETEVRLENERL